MRKNRKIHQVKIKILIAALVLPLGLALAQVLPGAYQTNEYLPLIDGKKVAIVGNQNSMINHTHLVDSLLDLNVNIVKVFAPEHGFRGEAEAGAHIADGKDAKTGLKIVSLYGNNKKPTTEQLSGVDVILFDLQGVGVRFYTYISTLKYMMEACAEAHIHLIVLDRPNPHAHYIDGPMLDKSQISFVGLLPIPVVYGMTDAELALMINGEKWNEKPCPLTCIPIKNYTHETVYELPHPPSPNLPNLESIYLYPSLCFFEGTKISVGRGTDFPFQVAGYPAFADKSFSFVPKSKEGFSAKPKYMNETCYGLDLRQYFKSASDRPTQLNLKWFMDFYKTYPDKSQFFTRFFDKLAGTDKLQKQIESGMSEEKIRENWKSDLDGFRLLRAKYLLYP